MVKAIKKQNIVLIMAKDDAVFKLFNFHETVNSINKQNAINKYII